jgi:hypothetical protein
MWGDRIAAGEEGTAEDLEEDGGRGSAGTCQRRRGILIPRSVGGPVSR